MRRSTVIGSVTVIKSLDRLKIIPDDRQKVIQLSDDNWVEDYGHIASGDRISSSFIVTRADWATIVGYWENRTKVDVTDEAGTVYTGRRVVVKSYQIVERIFPDYIKCELEFWAI